VARKLPALQRILGPEAIFAIIYGEISSSLYFTLGVVALYALGLTPLVLIFAGILFALAAGAYAEGGTMLASSGGGGSSSITGRAFGDLAGFVVGWAVVLDFIVVVALSTLFVPHYAIAAYGDVGGIDHPRDELIAAALVVAIGAVRLVRRTRLYTGTLVVAVVDIVVQLTLAVLGLLLVFDWHVLTSPIDIGKTPSWNAIAYSIPLAMVAFAGIEVVAVMLREAKKPGQALARGTISAVVSTVVVYAVIAAAALSAFPVHPAPGTPSGAASDLSLDWLNAPLAGVAQAIGDTQADNLGDALRAIVAISGVLILLVNAVTAFSGATRVLRALGEKGALPAPFAAQSRRSLTSPAATLLVVVGVCAIFPVASLFSNEVTGLVSIYAFGILLAFMAVFLAIVFLRATEPDLPRPLRMGWNVRFGRIPIPMTALIGFALSWLSWLLVLGTHRAARIVAPLWLAGGLVVYVVLRRRRGLGVLSTREVVPTAAPEHVDVPYRLIVVPVKQAGPIEDEMLATACKLAQSEAARVVALKAIEVPLAEPLDMDMPEQDRMAADLRGIVEGFAFDYGVDVELRVLRTRAISSGIASEARKLDAGLILLGAVPHKGSHAGRAQVFSETVENLLRRAHCRVIVTAFPPGTASLPEPEPAPAHAHAHG
jgi:APA family basic amino acid/polyamine antiporter